MNICVATNLRPFRMDPSANVADALTRALKRNGHLVEHVRLPVDDRTTDLLTRSSHAAALMRFDGYDLVIALGFPVCLVGADRLLAWTVDVPPLLASTPVALQAWRVLLDREHTWLASTSQCTDGVLAPVVPPRAATDEVWWNAIVAEVTR